MNKFLVSLIALFILIPYNAWAGEFRGLIEPHRVLKIGSPSEGIIKSINVERGDHVRKGQVLGSLQSAVEHADVKLAKTRKEFFLGKKKRVEQLYRKEFASPSEMEEAHTNWAVSELEHKRAQEVLKRSFIISPVNGVVVELFLSSGEYVKEQPVLKIAEIDPLNVEVIIPAAEFPKIKRGMQATVIPEAPDNGRYTATVTIVDRVIDGGSGTFGVRLEMPNPGYRVLSGLKCKVIFPDK